MPPNSAGKYVGEQKNSNILKSVQLKKQVLKPQKRNQPASTPMKSSPNGTTYNDFAQELDQTKRQCLRSSVLATCKPGGSRTTQCHQNKKKNLRKALRKSRKNFDFNFK
ncbi:hypothetical protein CEXT_518701 [Caerostris extrusa]|uniref:Uncharacterized protein n=1 Tax=Caerostris extrusa TaxID=172846 RepID=A0AAV4TYK8_CAEEX|nr:hypothetical protein CEXT_518701 [Caerostris extrusa]